jgi:spore maturation protein CgeB
LNKVLIIGSTHKAALEHIYAKHLSTFGNAVEIYPIQDIFLSHYTSSLFNKIIFRLGWSSIYAQLQKKVLSFVAEFEPSHIIVFKGMELLPSTLHVWKSKGIKLINYNPDNPFLFSGRGSGNENVSNSILLFDLYCSYDSSIVKQLQDRGVKSALVPFGFELDELEYQKIQNTPEINRVCFLGNPDKERAKFINSLINQHIDIDLYGTNWNQYIPSNSSSVKIHPPVYGLDFWKTLRRYAVQLNLMRIHNLNSHNMRSFDIPGVGGIMLAPRTVDHQLYFEEGKEVFLFQNQIECVKSIHQLLSMHKDKRTAIRNAARNKSVLKYKYQHQVYLMNTQINEL